LFGFWSLGGNCPKRANSFRQFIFCLCAKIIFCRESNEVIENKDFSASVKNRIKIASIDVAYIAVTILTVISFVTKSESIFAFHLVFVQVGLLILYFFVRTTEKNTSRRFEGLKVERSERRIKIPQTHSRCKTGIFHFMKGGIIVGIGFIVAVIGLVQFAMGKPVVSTFGRTSFLGSFLAMNAAICFGLVLENLGNQNFGIRCSVFGNRWWEISCGIIAFAVIFFVTILTKSRTAIIALAVVLPIIVFATKTRRLKEK